MSGFSYAESPVAVTEEIALSHQTAWDLLAQPGTWFTSTERLAIAGRARTLFADRATPPWARSAVTTPELSDSVADVVDLVTLNAGTIDRPAAENAIAAIGEGHYVELIGVVATVVMIDIFAEGLGVDRTPLPKPLDGEPTRDEPDGLGDIGAHVRALDPFPFANVARALSLVPAANALFRTVSVPTYSAPGFADLEWETPLSRPQVELVASRVAAINECFY